MVHNHAAKLAATYKGDGKGGDRLDRIRLYNNLAKISNVEHEKCQDAALDQGLQISTNANHKPKSVLQKQDNHRDVERRVVPDKNSVTVAWDKSISSVLSIGNQKTPVHYATLECMRPLKSWRPSWSDHAHLQRHRKANVHHGYGWTYLLSETQDHYVKAATYY